MAQMENVFDTEAAAQAAVDADLQCCKDNCKCMMCDTEDPDYDVENDGGCSCAEHAANIVRFDFVRQANDGKWCYMVCPHGCQTWTQREYDSARYE